MTEVTQQQHKGFPGGLAVKNLPAMQETWVQSLVGEDLLEEGMATHFSMLDWRIPWTEEPGAGYSPQNHEELDMTKATEHACTHGGYRWLTFIASLYHAAQHKQFSVVVMGGSYRCFLNFII